MNRVFSPAVPPIFDDETIEWIDVTKFGGIDRNYMPGLRDYGPKGFRWLAAFRDYYDGAIDADEYERRLDDLLGLA